MAETTQNKFRCHWCGKEHPGPPLSWALKAPSEWFGLTALQRRSKGKLSSDQCTIAPDRFFVRGSVELPLVDSSGKFVWDIWVSLSETNFKRANDRWSDPNRTEEHAYFGWFCNSLPGYPETLGLKVNVHMRAVGIRPFVELEPTDHPLAVEQRVGITRARMIEFAELAMHHPKKMGRPFGLPDA